MVDKKHRRDNRACGDVDVSHIIFIHVLAKMEVRFIRIVYGNHRINLADLCFAGNRLANNVIRFSKINIQRPRGCVSHRDARGNAGFFILYRRGSGLTTIKTRGGHHNGKTGRRYLFGDIRYRNRMNRLGKRCIQYIRITVIRGSGVFVFVGKNKVLWLIDINGRNHDRGSIQVGGIGSLQSTASRCSKVMTELRGGKTGIGDVCRHFNRGDFLLFVNTSIGCFDTRDRIDSNGSGAYKGITGQNITMNAVSIIGYIECEGLRGGHSRFISRSRSYNRSLRRKRSSIRCLCLYRNLR